MYVKIIGYFTIKLIITGFVIAILCSGAIYLDWLGIVNPLLNTIIGIMGFYILLKNDRKVWFWSGFWIGGLWFWWISMSFFNYGFPWAIPFGIIFTATVYGFIFWFIAKMAEKVGKFFNREKLLDLTLKSLSLIYISYIHPLGFDWFKAELIFTNSYLGIEKWQFAIVLISLSLTIYKEKNIYLFLIPLAYPFSLHINNPPPLATEDIFLVNTMITVDEKWDAKLQNSHIEMVFKKIEEGIRKDKKLIIFPESVFAFYLNTKPNIMSLLENYSNKIDIVLGALYWDKDNIPRNSTYIFKNGRFRIANKVVLVPFGEQNPLPKWMGKIVNDIFFDGAPDYVASSKITDYVVNGKKYRNAICYEGTSEKLYRDNPKRMILISNNGWVTPSIEPTEQKILLQYYSKKYGTIIYHAVNMSPSYIVYGGEVITIN